MNQHPAIAAILAFIALPDLCTLVLVAMNDEGRWAVANTITPARVLPDFHARISVVRLPRVNPGAVNIR
jgi:hypothetical protein